MKIDSQTREIKREWMKNKVNSAKALKANQSESNYRHRCIMNV